MRFCCPSPDDVAAPPKGGKKPPLTKQPSRTRLRRSVSGVDTALPQPERLGTLGVDVYEASGTSNGSHEWEEEVTEAFVKGMS